MESTLPASGGAVSFSPSAGPFPFHPEYPSTPSGRIEESPMRKTIGLFPLIVAAAVVLVAPGCQKKETEEAGAPVDTTATTMTEEPSQTGAPGAAPAGDDVGAQVYEANCATCHGSSGKGDGPAGAGLQPVPANFTDSEWKYGGDLAAVKKTIENGVPGTAMIAWKGTLSDAEIEAVANHEIAFSQGGASASAR
jgi:mono/diheme cytochrome c family protein